MDPLSLVGLGMSVLVTASLIALHAGKAIVPRVGVFATGRPDVYLVRGMLVTRQHVEAAIAALKDTQYQYGRVIETDSTARVPGAIVVGPASQEQIEKNRIASAQWSVSFDEIDPDELDAPDLVTEARDVLGNVIDGLITESYIGIDPVMLEGRDPVRIIAHELVHANGGLHTETAPFGRKREKLTREEREARKAAGEKHPKGELTDEARFGVVGRKTGELMNPVYEKGGFGLTGMGPQDLNDEVKFVKRARAQKA